MHYWDFVEEMLKKGLAKHLDIFSVHYVNDFAEIQKWRDLLKKHDVKLPIWDTEERAESPTIALAKGVERQFNFMHVKLAGPAGEEDYASLCNTDFTVRPMGIWFSVGAHCIGAGKYVESQKLGEEDYFAVKFARGKESVLVLSRLKEKAGLERVRVKVEPILVGKPVTVTDRLGRSKDLKMENGRAEIMLENQHTLYVNGAKTVMLEK